MKHLLIDANNLLYRAHFVSSLTDKEGNRISGAFNSMRMVNNLMKKFRPDSVVIAWDLGKSKSRLALYPEYKSHRDKNRKEEDKIAIAMNMKILKEIFANLPVKQIEVQDVEADDIIWWLTTKKLKGRKVIVSNDTDFLQLVDDKTSLYMPQAKPVWTKWDKSKKLKPAPYLITPSGVDKFIGFPRKHYVLWKSLVGDDSDTIKGVKGIGPKKAFLIIHNGLVKKKKLPINSEEMKILDRNKYLISIGAILQDDEVKAIGKAYRKSKEGSLEVKYSRVRKLFRRYNFMTLIHQFEEFEIRFNKILRKEKNGKGKKEKESVFTDRLKKGREKRKKEKVKKSKKNSTNKK